MMLILMQGLPGSGKSTKAKQIYQQTPHSVICSTDDFRYDERGEYVHNHEDNGKVHGQNQQRVWEFLCAHLTVIVDNTNTTQREAQPYIDMAKTLGCPIKIVKCEYPGKDSHGVPEHIIEVMKARMQDLHLE